MTVRLSVAIVATATALVGATPQSAPTVRIYVDVPSSSSVADYAVDVDGTVVSAATLTHGPQPLFAIVLHDVSKSMKPSPLDAIARRIAGTVSPGDNVRLATFADRISDRPDVPYRAGPRQRRPREVTQAGGASPLWDAIGASVDALRTVDRPSRRGRLQ